MNAHEPAGAGYERRDAEARPLLSFGVALALVVAVVLASMAWLQSLLTSHVERSVEPHPLAELREVPPPPLLQADPPDEVEEHLRWEREVLSSYGWVDAEAGIVHVPIERAIELVLERGLPVREDPGGS